MPALFAIVVMAGLAVHPAIDTTSGTPKLDTSKLTIEQTYKFND